MRFVLIKKPLKTVNILCTTNICRKSVPKINQAAAFCTLCSLCSWYYQDKCRVLARSLQVLAGSCMILARSLHDLR